MTGFDCIGGYWLCRMDLNCVKSTYF